MKKALLLIYATFFVLVIFAQTPTIPFQAIARDTNGVLIANRGMAVRISIHDSIPPGNVVYKETQSVTTNNLGMFTLNIGSGTIVTGTYSSINWSHGAKYVQIEVDPAGGTSYLNLGTSQLNAVPFALYAANSGGGGFKAPTSCIPYGGNVTMVSDSNFTRDSITQRTQIICSPPGANYISYLRVDNTQSSLGLWDASAGYVNLLTAGQAGEFGFAPNCVVAATLDGYHNVMHGFYAMKDSTEMITTELDSNGNYSTSSHYGLAGTRAYSAYFDVLYNNGTSLNSLTADADGVHWEYNNVNQYTLPLTDGSSGQVISTDGSGHLTFTNIPANTLNGHQVLTGTTYSTDTITIQNHKNNIYKPTSSVTSLAVNLPSSPSDGDTFILTFAAAVSSITYQSGTVGTSAPTAATATLQKIFTYDASGSTWY